jgi:hypothetical protein
VKDEGCGWKEIDGFGGETEVIVSYRTMKAIVQTNKLFGGAILNQVL